MEDGVGVNSLGPGNQSLGQHRRASNAVFTPAPTVTGGGLHGVSPQLCDELQLLELRSSVSGAPLTSEATGNEALAAEGPTKGGPNISSGAVGCKV